MWFMLVTSCTIVEVKYASHATPPTWLGLGLGLGLGQTEVQDASHATPPT